MSAALMNPVNLIDSKLPELANQRLARSRISRAGLMGKSIERMELVHGFVKRAFSGSLHAKRILSLAVGTGGSDGASLAVKVTGRALAQARGLSDRHAIKPIFYSFEATA